MAVVIPVYSEQALSPQAGEVLRGIVTDSFPHQMIKFTLFNPSAPAGVEKVLVFGSITERTWSPDVTPVYTYSIAQMMTKANAASVITAGLRHMLTDPDPIPFEKPVPVISVSQLRLDFDKPVAIDIETSGNLGKEHTPEEVGLLSVAFYQPGRPPYVLVSASTRLDENGKEYNADINRTELDLLSSYIVKFKYAIYHNGKFDVRVLNRVLGVRLCVWFDTMLAHHTLNMAAGDHKLKTCARRYLGAPEWETDLGKYTKGGGHYEYIPVSMLVEYNGWDVYWTYQLYEFFAPQILANENFQKSFKLEMSAADFLLEVEEYGIPVDTQYAKAFSLKLDFDASARLSVLRIVTHNPNFRPNSPKQVKEFLESNGVFLESTKEEFLQELIAGSNPVVAQFCRELLAYRKAMKTKSTYADGWSSRSRNGRVHPTFMVHGTSTGRLSSTSPNAQNMPREKEIRKLVRVHDG